MYTLKETTSNSNGIKTLFRNGHVLFCPHGSKYCGDWCPAFEIKQRKESYGTIVTSNVVTLYCFPEILNFTINKEET